MSNLETVTFSMLKTLRNCQRKCKFRYFEGLIPRERNENLWFGSLIHECLELHYRNENWEDFIDESTMNRDADPDKKRMWHYAHAMMKAYAAKFLTEPFVFFAEDFYGPPAIEKKFEVPIVNPSTGAKSRSFMLKGKVDGVIVMDDGRNMLLEHKTASAVDESYWEKLWTDFQITLYSQALEEELGIKIDGVLYNVLIKPGLRQSQEESEEDFEARKAKLLAKSKTGKTTASRREGEGDDEFRARLEGWFAEGDRFQRKEVQIVPEQKKEVKWEVWQNTQMLLDCRRNDVFCRNTDRCFDYNRPCEYYPICRPGVDKEPIIGKDYVKSEPHVELRT